MLASAPPEAKAGLHKDPTLSAAVHLSDRIAKGDSGAARELVATDAVARLDERKVNEKNKQLVGKTLHSKELQDKTRQILMDALVAAGIVDDLTSAKWRELNFFGA